MHVMDRLYESVSKKGIVCLGLDTSLDYIPEELKNGFHNIEDLLFEFNKKIIDATEDKVACFKVQIAYYEALGLSGLKAYSRTLKYLKEIGSITIADIKRGDIADTAKMYARAHFQGDFEADIITLSPYMGLDSIDPYVDYLKSKEKGVFVLVRTSNKGAEDIQYIEHTQGEKIYNTVGKKIQKLGEGLVGEKGYSSIGAVIGCTHVEEAKQIREELNSTFFLIPGYGAQGGKAEDVALYLKEGNGGVVNSSRKILLAYKERNSRDFALCAREEAIRMNDEIMSKITT